ncbi:OLC1v1030868C1 [Oldenlandia corymbosa var. corymbosa]|uniref:OLC1v1030868C1 n=1 Tax=Oldenlandia corymbosa var. corymbosa TaxID=529605 RepID=A0AAV1CI53_OLDCO|nr:OLC1v1030868C1 [Oldenlandia corymbosa var. corymbosa]
MGFGTLLDLKIKNIPIALYSFLPNNFQTGARQVPLNGNNVLDIKQEDVVVVLDLPRGPKPVEEFKQNDLAIMDHAEIVDAFKKRMGYSNKFLPTRSTAAQLIASRKDYGDDFKRDFLVFVLCYLDRCEYERAHPRSFPVIKFWDQKMLDDRLRLQRSNFTDVQTLERLKKPSSAAFREEHPEGESQKEDTQANPNTQQDLAALDEKFYQLIISMSKTVLDIREKEMELKIEPDEQTKQTIKILTDAMGLEQLSQTNDEDSLPVGQSVPTSKEVVVDEQQTQPQAHGTNMSTTEKKRSHQDSTGRDSGVTSTYTRRTRSTGTRKRKVFKDPTIPHFGLGIFSSQEDSYETTQEKNTEEDITGSVDLDKDVDETIEAEEYPVSSALDETKNPTPSIDEIIRRASAPASKSLSDIKKLEMIAAAAEEVEKNSKEADELDEELTKTVEKKLLFEFGKIVWADRTAFYSMREGTWIENSIIDAWAVILNKEEAKSDSPRRIFFGVSSFGSNKDEIELTFYERLGLELEEQGLTVASLLAAKAIYFPVHYQDHYFLYVLLVEEKKVLVRNNIHAKDLDYYNPTKDLLFQFFKSYVACVFPRIELVSTQYTFTERYDGGEYEDGTTLDFNTGNIKEYRWEYIIKILMHPVNKNKDKIFEAMHQFYTNTAKEEQNEIPDHVDLAANLTTMTEKLRDGLNELSLCSLV